MKKFLKKAVSITVASILMMSIISGCAKKKTEVDENGRMTITWLGIPWGSAMEQDKMYAKKIIEDKFNVNLEIINYDTEQYENKKPLLLSGDNVPDIIYDMDPSQLQADVKQGFLLEIPYEMLLEKCPDIVAEINEQVPELWLYSYAEGKNWGIPNIGYSGSDNKVGIWRTDWLKNVGIEKIPETIEEMHDALYKFTHNDPDGNGIKDTYGMSGDMNAWYMLFSEIFCAYGAMPFSWIEKDGKIVYGGLENEVKDVLKILSDWYAEGIIDPDFITDKFNTTGLDKLKNGKIGYINQGGSYATTRDTETSVLGIAKQINPNAELECAPPVAGPDGQRGTFAWGKGGHINAFGRHLKDEPEKLNKILEIFEYISTNQDFAQQLRMGERGVHYEFIDESKGYRGGVKALSPYDDQKEANKYGITTSVGGFSFFSPISVKREKIDELKSDEVKLFEERCIIEGLGKTDVFLKPDVVPSAVTYLNDLRSKQLIYISDIIRGKKTVEQYDEFIKDWNMQGGKTMEEDANKLFDELENIYSKVNIK